MISWSLRLRYGRGAARIAVSLPRPGLEMVRLHPSREIVASIFPLYLAALLPAGMCLTGMLMSMIELLPREPSAPSPVVLIDYLIDDSVGYQNPEPALAQPTKAHTDPAPIVAEAQPQPRPLPALLDPISEALSAIAIDGLDVMGRARGVVAVARVRDALRAEARPTGPLASEFAPVAGDAPPVELPASARLQSAALALPAVSLRGPALSAALEGVEALRATPFRSGLGTPQRPAVARLPQPATRAISQLAFPAVADRSMDGSVAAGGGIDGVPLETLAACRSREREDALKQQLMLAVTNGSLCSAAGGSYRFLETKNLNAFLMRVARDSERELGNRCDELMRAQMCVEAQRVGRVQP